MLISVGADGHPGVLASDLDAQSEAPVRFREDADPQGCSAGDLWMRDTGRCAEQRYRTTNQSDDVTDGAAAQVTREESGWVAQRISLASSRVRKCEKKWKDDAADLAKHKEAGEKLLASEARCGRQTAASG